MRFRTLLPALLGTLLMLGAASPASADRDWRRDSRGPGWQDRSWHDRGWHNRAFRERAREQAWREREWRQRAWREQLWRERQAQRFYNPPVGIAPGYQHWYR